MFCPNCAKENSTEQKFCRSCGLNLEKTAQALMEQMPNSEGISNSQVSRFFETVGKIGFGGLVGSGVVGFLILLLTIFNKFILSGQTDKIIIGFVFITLLISAFGALSYVIFREIVKEKNKSAKPILQNEIKGNDTAKLLEEKYFDPIPGVTENTTNLLFTDLRAKSSGELK